MKTLDKFLLSRKKSSESGTILADDRKQSPITTEEPSFTPVYTKTRE